MIMMKKMILLSEYKKIKCESKQLASDKDYYETRMDFAKCHDDYKLQMIVGKISHYIHLINSFIMFH